MTRTAAVCLLAITLGTCGCDRSGVNAYRAPKDPPPPPAAAQSAPGDREDQGPPQLRWTLPSGWQELPASQMRVGNFSATGNDGQKAQITIIPLAGQGGGDLENVNRWRGQVGASRLTQEEINQQAEPVEIAGAPGRLFDFAGKTLDEDKPTRLIAGILHREGTAWFFKMIGDDAFVATQKPAFVAFLKSVRFEAPGASAAPAAQAAPAAPEPRAAAPTPPAPAAASGSKPAWTVPGHWREQAAGAMQTAKFAADSDAGKAEVTVSLLGGEGGGRVPNVNRWRGQIGLPPADEAEIAKSMIKLEVPGAQTYAVELVAEATKRRMVAAGVSRGGQTWFYKLMGDDAAVTREKEAFLSFIHSVTYAH